MKSKPPTWVWVTNMLVVMVAVALTVFGGTPLRPHLGAAEPTGATTTAPLPVPAGSGRTVTTRQSESVESSVTGTALRTADRGSPAGAR